METSCVRPDTSDFELTLRSIDPGDGTVGFESANVRFSNIAGSPWLNFKFGKFELDGPLSEKRMMTFSNVGGAYQLYHFSPIGDVTDFSFGETSLVWNSWAIR